MSETKIISLEKLSEFGFVENLNEQAKSLLNQQKETWEMAGRNFEALNRIQARDFDFGHFKVATQFNPERIRSSAAKTDAKSLAERPCFLCRENLYDKQRGILFQKKYLVLINLFPIFSNHLVIAAVEHIPQQILPYFADMLDLSEKLSDFTVFYNGPKCGASAPDHFHFQAIGKGNLPLENEFELLEESYSETLVQTEKLKVISVGKYLRKFVAIISSDKKIMKEKFEQIYNLMDLQDGEEPMMNVLCNFIGNKWHVIIFPRSKQRPSCFFREGESKMVVGAATVEMGGVIILPREEDFVKITSDDIAEIYDDVIISDKKFSDLIRCIKNIGV